MTATTVPPTAIREVKRHPVRGALWGFLLGFGIALYAVLFAVIPFGDWLPLLLCVIAGIGLGLVWAYFAPAKEPKEGPPSAAPIEADDAPPAERDEAGADDEAADAVPGELEADDDGPDGTGPEPEAVPEELGADDVTRVTGPEPDDSGPDPAPADGGELGTDDD